MSRFTDYIIDCHGGVVWECNCGSPRCRRVVPSSFFELPVGKQLEYLPLLNDWFVKEHREEVEALRGLAGGARMMPKKSLKHKAAAALFAPLLAFAPCVAAQAPPRVKKSVTRGDRARWRGVLAWPESCEEAYRESYPNEETYGGLEFHRLGRGRYLVEVVCDGGGVQPSAVFMLYEGRRARSLRLRGFEDETEVRALTRFLPRTRELLLMSKADAMGTCGLFVRYSFAAARPRVVEARQDDCGGPRATPDAGRWPRVRLKE